MKCYIGVGSNLDNPRSNLEKAIQELSQLANRDKPFRISPIYKTPALVPDGSPSEWMIPYLNVVVEMHWTQPAEELLSQLKKIELKLGRKPSERWAPRIIDLDILVFGDHVIRSQNLQIPHTEIIKRSFVLDPLRDLAPNLIIPGQEKTVVELARELKTHSPLIMGIVNLTPDSFSDGGEISDLVQFENKLKHIRNVGLQCIDFGAESTRPGAQEVDSETEWKRLHGPLELTKSFFASSKLKPLISVDTRHSQVAEKSLALGVDIINDVSGLEDPRMISILKNSECDYVLMHSLCVPADPRKTFSEIIDPVVELKKWFEQKCELLCKSGIDLSRIIFDPGIGFGKTPQQNIELLQRMNEFKDLPVRILVGHSRKSFMKKWGLFDKRGLDSATLSISTTIAHKGVDIVRVHDYESHLVGMHAMSEVI